MSIDTLDDRARCTGARSAVLGFIEVLVGLTIAIIIHVVAIGIRRLCRRIGRALNIDNAVDTLGIPGVHAGTITTRGFRFSVPFIFGAIAVVVHTVAACVGGLVVWDHARVVRVLPTIRTLTGFFQILARTHAFL